MELDVSRALAAPGEEVPFALAGTLPDTDWNGDTLRFLEPVTVEGVAAALGESVLLRAIAKAKLSLPCADCLSEVAFDQTAKLDVRFERTPDPDDPDLFAYTGHTLPLTDAVLGALLLALPMRVLCRPDCAGLCPACGVNRNITPCTCQKEAPTKHPFEALAALLNKDEEV